MRHRYFRKPHKIKRKKPILKNRFFWLAILVLIVLGSAFYFFIFSSFFQLKEVKIIGCQMVSKERLRNLIWQTAEKKILFFSTKSIFLINLGYLDKYILQEFPQVCEVNFKRNFPGGLQVKVKEKLPIGIWCSRTEECFLIDKEGIIFNSVSDKESANLLIKTSKPKQKVNLGAQVINQDDLTVITKIQRQLKEKGVTVKEFVPVSETQLQVRTEEGWWIYFNPKGNIGWQITELNLVLQRQIPPQKRKALKYIDLRFDRVFVFPENVLVP